MKLYAKSIHNNYSPQVFLTQRRTSEKKISPVMLYTPANRIKYFVDAGKYCKHKVDLIVFPIECLRHYAGYRYNPKEVQIKILAGVYSGYEGATIIVV